MKVKRAIQHGAAIPVVLLKYSLDEDKAVAVSENNTIPIISHFEAEVHSGKAFSVVLGSEDLDIDATIDLTLITPNNELEIIHAKFSAEGTGAIHLYIYEAPTTETPGAPVAAFNHNRNSLNTSSATLRSGDTFDDPEVLGTLLWEWHTGDKKLAGSAEAGDEWLLKLNTQYLFRVVSEIDNNKVSMEVFYFEDSL